MRWQYCPPASRSVICACNPATLGTAILLRYALHQQFLGVFQQSSGFRHGLDGLSHGRILLLSDALRILVTERGDVHLPLQLFLDPLMVFGEVAFVELDSALEQKLVKVVHDVLIRLPALGELGVGLTAEILGGEVEQRILAEDLNLKLVELRRRVLLVGRNAAAAVNG